MKKELFDRDCLQWRERMEEGEFKKEKKKKMKDEDEKEMSSLDKWKMKNFEKIWGEKNEK
jgi:hypothetical protein